MSAPNVNGPEPAFIDALRAGAILAQRCDDCAAHRFPRMPYCAYCGSGSDRDVPLSGSATLYSWIVIHRTVDPAFREQTPYAIGIVDIEVSEGLVRVPARIETEEFGSLVHDQPLQLIPPQGDATDIRFRPVGS